MTTSAGGSPYTEEFYGRFIDGSLAGARAILPEILRTVPVTSIVDVGCGVGGWLEVAGELGVATVCGVDGANVERQSLRIALDQFISADLEVPGALDSVGRFDLAICLEVAEHLRIDRASSLIAELTGLAPAVLFSAAIPGQGGTHHVNEQWQSWWADRFGERGFLPIDVRWRFWNDRSIPWWYRQNIVLYVDHTSDAASLAGRSVPDVVIPKADRVALGPAAESRLGWLRRVSPGVRSRAVRRTNH